MSEQFNMSSVPDWLTQLGALIGAGGSSVLAVKVVERIFKRDDRQAADRTSISGELRQDIRDLKVEVRELQTELEGSRDRENRYIERNARLEAENEALRERYHGVMNFMQILVDRDARHRAAAGLPPEDIDIPNVFRQRVPGPTAGRISPLPPEQPS